MASMISSNKITIKGSSPNNNIESLKTSFKFNSKTGKFGDKGKNSQIIKATDPVAESLKFFNKISKGGDISKLANGKGDRVDFTDGTTITYRVVTSTPKSPAVDINVKVYNKGKISSQKIHFIKKEE